jgi:cytochrome c553
MIRLMTLISVAALSVSIAHAEPSSNVAFDLPTLKLFKMADAERGKDLADKARCSRCHGDNGVSDDEDDVNIAGLMASYAFKQMKDYQDEKRDSRDMLKNVRDLNDQQLADLAVYYESLPAAITPKREMTPEVEQLIITGDPKRLIKGCGSCHGRDGRGGQFDHPALTGQNKNYFIETMEYFRDGDRTNDVYSRMRVIAEALTEEEIEALASYYAAEMPAE